MSEHIRRSALLLALLIMCGATSSAFAASPSVTALLSSSDAEVGQAVELQIKVTGARSANVPAQIPVDGLEVRQTGTSQQIEMRNFDVTSSVIYNYTILPLRSGKFTIPPQTIRIGNDSLRTPELTLNVSSASSSSVAAPQTNQSAPGARPNAGKIAFAELVVAKKDAYVGEMVPAEIRLGFDPRAHGRLEEGPELSGQGFTTQKLQEPRQTMETIGGRTYQVYTFKTAIAPARAGKFELGPVEAKAMVVVPRRPSGPRVQRPRSPFDLFNMDDPFSDPFFSDPFGSMGERTEISLKSESVTLDVKPLPPNAPANFSGAVGSFAMTVDAKPKTLQVGDPVTVTATISGRGNFDRMTGPVVEDERGWHKYPPSSKFKQDDDVGMSGEKTFETVIAPNEKKSAVPSLAFAFFDPTKENYVTLRSNPVAIQVEGGAAPASTAAATSSANSPATAAGPAPSEKPEDILYQLNNLGAIRSFSPIYARSTFWIAQLAPLIVLLGFVGWKIRQAKIHNRAAQRVAALQHETAELLRKLRRSELTPQEYFSNASRVARVKAALAKNIDPNAVDTETIAKTFELDENEYARLRTLFERTDELRYSGGGNGNNTVAKQDREEVLTLLESLHA